MNTSDSMKINERINIANTLSRSWSRSGMRKVRTTQSTTPFNEWGSDLDRNTASIAENNRHAFGVIRVKKCGKSARLSRATC